jgi:hypothetical protein
MIYFCAFEIKFGVCWEIFFERAPKFLLGNSKTLEENPKINFIFCKFPDFFFKNFPQLSAKDLQSKTIKISNNLASIV